MSNPRRRGLRRASTPAGDPPHRYVFQLLAERVAWFSVAAVSALTLVAIVARRALARRE